jgi:hypothetical protein
MGWRVTERLPAVDGEGRRYVVVEMRLGMEIDFILENGLAVTRQADGTFRIDETGKVLSIVGR